MRDQAVLLLLGTATPFPSAKARRGRQRCAGRSRSLHGFFCSFFDFITFQSERQLVTNPAVRHGTDFLLDIVSLFFFFSFFSVVWFSPCSFHPVSCRRCRLVAYPSANRFSCFMHFLFHHFVSPEADGKLLLTEKEYKYYYIIYQFFRNLLPRHMFCKCWRDPGPICQGLQESKTSRSRLGPFFRPPLVFWMTPKQQPAPISSDLRPDPPGVSQRPLQVSSCIALRVAIGRGCLPGCGRSTEALSKMMGHPKPAIVRARENMRENQWFSKSLIQNGWWYVILTWMGILGLPKF